MLTIGNEELENNGYTWSTNDLTSYTKNVDLKETFHN